MPKFDVSPRVMSGLTGGVLNAAACKAVQLCSAAASGPHGQRYFMSFCQNSGGSFSSSVVGSNPSLTKSSCDFTHVTELFSFQGTLTLLYPLGNKTL